MQNCSNKGKLACIAIATVSMLTACGGGDDGASSAEPNTATAEASIDKYLGVWKSDECIFSGAVTQLVNGVPQDAKSLIRITTSKLTDAKANLRVEYTFYAPSDSDCRGAPILTVIKTGDSTGSFSQTGTSATSSQGQNVWTVASSEQVDGQAADQVSYTESSLAGSMLSGSGPATFGFANDVSLNATRLGDFTDKYSVKVVNNKLMLAFDASAGNPYAKTFTPSGTVSLYTYTKQQ